MLVLRFLIVFMLLLLPATAFAEDNAKKGAGASEKLKTLVLEPVTVTATKREESLEKVPASISTVSDTQIEEMGAWKLGEVLDTLPNVWMKNATSGDGIVIRGLSSFDTSIYSPVGLYVDDVPYPVTYMQNLLFLDVERIEVLRGPQGTLYGRNSEAGVVNVVLKKPDNQVRASVFSDYGSYNTLRAGANVSTPLIKDKLFLAGNFVRYQTDGYMHNEYKDDDRAAKDESMRGRGVLRWTPTDAFDLRLTMDASHTDKGIGRLRYETGSNATKRFNVISDASDDAEENVINPSFTAKYSGPAVEVTSITSYMDYRYQFLSDRDRTSTFKSYSDQDLKQQGITQELRFASPGKQRLNWLFGLFGSSTRSDIQMNAISSVSKASTYADTDATESSWAAFGQATYSILDNLRLTAGLRGEYALAHGGQTHRVGTTSLVGYSKELDSFEVLPMASLAYDVTPNVTAYATWSNGFLAGGFNYYAADSLSTFYYQPEHTTNYEVGLKTNWFNQKLIANVSVFYTDIRDKQVREEDPAGGIGVWKFTNAGRAHSQGVEVELTGKPLAGLELQGGLGYTYSVVDDWTVNQNGVPYSYKGKRLPWAPDLTYHLGAGYAHPCGLFARADLYGAGTQYFDAENSLSQEGFALVNARVGYAFKQWELALWGKNIFDVDHATKKVRDRSRNVLVEDGAPQTFGASLTWRF
ncbi:TonB-dependent receptor [Solidesulfovibrio fructosivorans JJ]]|uniref:TonB-dependent receptor n=1 Tax=Solidesulfovibrio fructosivorans JJ] TaxID=596151 RepID=E1JTG8_SOLFR|nr:TonB-dependent receptor [Solidesulfovibrio fructosivorans]EFL52428.1 TonB-dependent receptor [Solidesulfovibrio fructosivorans JJ]]